MALTVPPSRSCEFDFSTSGRQLPLAGSLLSATVRHSVFRIQSPKTADALTGSLRARYSTAEWRLEGKAVRVSSAVLICGVTGVAAQGE
jgi:hypothetical protein